MQYEYCFLVFLSTVSVAVLFEVKKIYVIERDFKTGQLRARRQNVQVQPHTVARIGGLQDHHHQQQQQQQQQQQGLFNVAVSPPPLVQSAPVTTTLGGQPQQLQPQQPLDLATTVDLTSDNRGSPIDYLTPPPNTDFQFHNFQPSGVIGGGSESVPMIRSAESHQLQLQHNVPAVQAPPPPPLVPLTVPSSATAVHTSPFTPGGGGSGFPSVQVSSPSNQVHSLSIANTPLQEQFTPYTPTLQQTRHEPANHHHQQPQSGGGGGRWDLGFDASDILTPPFASASEQSGSGVSTFFHQDFGQDTVGATGSVRSNKQYPGGGSGAFFNGGGGGSGGSNSGNFDTTVATSNKFTPLDAVVRTSPSNNNGVYWGTPKTAQQQPIRPPPSFAEPNPYRFIQNNNNNHHHQHHHQYLDALQMPFTGQFDGPPLSQGTVAEHVVHSSFRIKRQLLQQDEEDEGSPPAAQARSTDEDDDDDGSSGRSDQFGDRKPVYSFVKTDKNGNFKWSVRHGY